MDTTMKTTEPQPAASQAAESGASEVTATPSNVGASTISNDATPSGLDVKPSMADPQQSGADDKPSGADVKPSGADVKPSGTDVTTPFGVDATKLTALDLNNIRLDVRHTVLTPSYLEDLIKKG